METTHEVVGCTRPLQGRVPSECRDLESEGRRGYGENPSLWWTAQTPFDVGGSLTNQIEQSTRCNHVENRQNGRLCAAVNTEFPSAAAGEGRPSPKRSQPGSWAVWALEIDRSGGCSQGMGRRCGWHPSFRTTGDVSGLAASHRWGLPPSALGVGSLGKRGHRHRPCVCGRSGRGRGNRE